MRRAFDGRRSPRRPSRLPPPAARVRLGEIVSDHTPEEYMANVETRARRHEAGRLLRSRAAPDVLARRIRGRASELFERVQQASPSPYEFLLQFGDEQLVGASPEMFVRVEGARVETCPISGTAQRTGDPLQRRRRTSASCSNSTKEESELTMCTDVDRNDKSRVCEPGSVKVIGRRLIESYAGVFHTVDHVEGTLQPGFDSLDAFLSHMWAVTVIGAPKKAAAQAIEDLEKNRARLVRRRGRHALAERRHQYRHPDPHDAPARRRGASIRWARRCSTIPSRRWRSARRG